MIGLNLGRIDVEVVKGIPGSEIWVRKADGDVPQ